MSRISPYFALVLLVLLSAHEILAADYENGLAPPGAPSSAFPTPGRPVAGIVTDIWRDEQSRDQAGEAETARNLLGVSSGLAVADIGAGSGYYTVRLAGRVGPSGHVYAEDIVPDYLARLARRVAREGLGGSITIVRGEPHDPRLPAASVDLVDATQPAFFVAPEKQRSAADRRCASGCWAKISSRSVTATAGSGSSTNIVHIAVTAGCSERRGGRGSGSP